MHGWGEESCVQSFGRRTLRKRDNLEDPGVYGRITFKWNFRKLDAGRGQGLD
jgi:hypothetical protein